jgi:hypothetical protein
MLDIFWLSNISILGTWVHLIFLPVLNNEPFPLSEFPSVPVDHVAKSIASKCWSMTVAWIFFALWLLLGLDQHLLHKPHITVQGMQQQSHSTPSPHGQEMHGFVDPLIGFETDETMDDDVEDGGMVNR